MGTLVRSAVSALLPSLLVTAVSSPSLPAQEDPGTPDVHLLARTIQEQVEVMRWHMGRPRDVRPPIPVEGASIRENFRQAMTLWQKVNQLGTELVGGGEPPPVVRPPREGEFEVADLHLVLTSVLERLEEVREGVGIVGPAGIESAEPPPLDPGATSSDIFQIIVQCNRQVNRLLERGAQPGDAYQQVHQAVFYASEILAAAGATTPLPLQPEYEPGLRPAHVYGRLLLVFDRLDAAFETLGLTMVTLERSAYVADETIDSSDVYDLATLLVSELEHLHALIPGARTPLQASHPGKRWPSDVYQLAGVLNAQAANIMVLAQDPDFLGEGRQIPAAGVLQGSGR